MNLQDRTASGHWGATAPRPRADTAAYEGELATYLGALGGAVSAGPCIGFRKLYVQVIIDWCARAVKALVFLLVLFAFWASNYVSPFASFELAMR